MTSMQCQDCFGTGRNKTGGPCRSCRGTGRVGRVALGFQMLGPLTRVGFAIAVVVAIAIAVIGGGSPAHHHRTATPTGHAPQTPDQIAAAQCELTLSFATKRLCQTEFTDAFDLVVLDNGQLGSDSFHAVRRLMARCEAQHHTSYWCGHQLGQALTIANRATS